MIRAVLHNLTHAHFHLTNDDPEAGDIHACILRFLPAFGRWAYIRPDGIPIRLQREQVDRLLACDTWEEMLIVIRYWNTLPTP